MDSRQWVATLGVACLVVVAGCARPGGAPGPTAKTAATNFVQRLVLDVDGKPVEVPLEKMDVFLTEEDRFPEVFEIRGTGVVLAGTFPKGVRVDYAENWSALVGRPIPISPRGGDPRAPEESYLTSPGQGRLKVLGGTFTVEQVGEGADAKTPLSGRIEIRCQSPEGAKTFRGTFAVNGTTWG